MKLGTTEPRTVQQSFKPLKSYVISRLKAKDPGSTPNTAHTPKIPSHLKHRGLSSQGQKMPKDLKHHRANTVLNNYTMLSEDY